MTIKEQFYSYIQHLQDRITSKLEEVDGEAQFQEDIWERPEGGGGIGERGCVIMSTPGRTSCLSGVVLRSDRVRSYNG